MEPQTQERNKRRLRTVLIHKPMQREFTLVVISLLIVSALAVGFVIHSTIREAMMGGGYRFGKISAYEVMSQVGYDLIVRVSLVLFITMVVIAAFGVLFLHRIAGPVYRFRGILRRVSQGEIPEDFRIREGDFFTETADDLNQVLRELRERRKCVEELQRKVEQAIQLSPSSQAAAVLKEIQGSLGELS